MLASYYLTAMVNNCVPRQQLSSCSVTRPFLSLQRVWLGRGISSMIGKFRSVFISINIQQIFIRQLVYCAFSSCIGQVSRTHTSNTGPDADSNGGATSLDSVSGQFCGYQIGKVQSVFISSQLKVMLQVSTDNALTPSMHTKAPVTLVVCLLDAFGKEMLECCQVFSVHKVQFHV